jgi:hypothetical protein
VFHEHRGKFPAHPLPDTLHQVHRCPVTAQYPLDQLSDPVADPQSCVVATGNERISGFEADQHFEHQNDLRTGHRDEAQHHAHRSGDFHHLALFVPVHHAHTRLPGKCANCGQDAQEPGAVLSGRGDGGLISGLVAVTMGASQIDKPRKVGRSTRCMQIQGPAS